MSHITYNEFKTRFGDLGITKYTKAMWLEEGCEEIGAIKIGDLTWTKPSAYFVSTPSSTSEYSDIEPITGSTDVGKIYIYDYKPIGIGPLGPGDYQRIALTTSNTFYINDNRFTTVEEFNAAMKDKVILYKIKTETVINPAIKTEGELGMIMNANGELQSGSGSVGSFKYEVTGGHTYDVVNAKAASSSYVKWLDADGNQIGSITVLNSTNFPKVGDTRPMPMPSNCKYVWLLKDSSKVDLPIALIS